MSIESIYLAEFQICAKFHKNPLQIPENIGPKGAHFYKGIYARGHVINWYIEVIICLYENYEELLEFCDIGILNSQERKFRSVGIHTN